MYMLGIFKCLCERKDCLEINSFAKSEPYFSCQQCQFYVNCSEYVKLFHRITKTINHDKTDLTIWCENVSKYCNKLKF